MVSSNDASEQQVLSLHIRRFHNNACLGMVPFGYICYLCICSPCVEERKMEKSSSF